MTYTFGVCACGTNMAENRKVMMADGDDDQTFEGEDPPKNITEELEESEGSNSSDLDEDEASSTNPRIQQLELQVETNPYHYDSHVELITILRETGDLDRVRTAREGMNKIFPLSEDLWTTWLKDEMPLAMGSLPEQAERVIALFERAVKDYQSMSLWILYCQFLMDTMQDPNDIQKIRLTFEKAITAIGLHVTEGPSIWEGYRKFERDLLESFEQMVTDENEEAMTEKISAQKDKVLSIFKRQLAVPLIGMQATLREFEDWLEDSVPEAVMIAYEKALAKLEECLSFEDLLATAQAPKVTEYKLYLEYELKKGDPARLQCLYERFVKDNCLSGDTWNEYTSYLDSKLKIPSVVIPVHERAVRNCPWMSILWQNYLRALERSKQDGDKVKETLNTALGCGFSSSDDYLQLWRCYCDYIRRKVEDWSEESQQVRELRETFTRATEYQQHYFGSDGDPTNILERYWARIEALHIGNISECQRLWDSVILSNHGREAEYWLEYSHLLRSCKNNQLCRKILQRAVQAASDNPEMVIQALLSFEREEGTLDDWDAAFSRCRVQLLRLNERRQKAAAKEEARAKAEKEMWEKRKLLSAEKKAAKKAEEKKAKIVKKRKAPDSGPKESPKGVDDTGEPVTKKPHIDSESLPGKTDFSARPEASVETSTTTAKYSHDSSKDPLTAFVSNLLFSVDEERIKDVFSPLGEITQIRLVKNYLGRSKGYAYVEFKDESAVQAALSLDRTNLDGRPMFISPSVDKSKNPTQFKFPTTLDKKTLFVSNLPSEIKESDLENLFREHGKLKQVRLASNRAGKPRGFGYIEYDEERAASAAIIALDGTQLGDRQISVALSNPPSRKSRQPVGSRGRARTQLQLIPRSLQKHTPPAPVPKAASLATSSSVKTEIKNGVEAKQQGFGNDFFRNLATKKN